MPCAAIGSDRPAQVEQKKYAEDGGPWSKHHRRLRATRNVGLVLVVSCVLNIFAVEPAEGGVVTLIDGSKQLTAPWTDAEHTTACPNSDPRPCPVLVLNNPAVNIRSQDAVVRLRDVVTLSQEEQDKGATVPFFVYSYKYDKQLSSKRYRVYSNVTDQYEITFYSMWGATSYQVQDAEACGVVTDANSVGALGRIATEDTGPLSFSVTATLPQINCFLGSVTFKKSGGKISSDMQLADDDIGAMSTLDILIQTAKGTANSRSAYKVSTVIFYESIMFQPKVKEGHCPSFSYPYPDATQLPLNAAVLPPAPQPVDIPAGWQRARLADGQGGLCLSRPINTYPAALPLVIQCPRAPYSGTLSAPTCQACAVTSSDWIYVFEDSPTVMTLSDIKFEDGDFFYGSADISLELIFDTHKPNFQGLGALLTAQSSATGFTYCAHTSVATRPCASLRSETFNNIWVPEAGKSWGVDYKIRIVNFADFAIFCAPGSAACPSIVSNGQFMCEDVPDSDNGKDLCPCKSGLCYSVNTQRRAQSRITSSVSGRSRLFFEVYAASTGEVGQRGYFDLFVAGAAGCEVTSAGCTASGFMYSYPKAMNNSFNWFRFSPMKIEGIYSEVGGPRKLSLTKVLTDVTKHPSLSMTVQSDYGFVHFPNAHASVVRAPTEPAQKVSLTGSLRELTITLSRIQYQVNRLQHPHLNTQTKGRAAAEHLKIVYDKSVNSAGKFDPGGIGPVTVFDFPVHVLATNDRPYFVAPKSYNATENVLTHVAGVSVIDVDADEVFAGSGDMVPTGACPSLPGEAHHLMTLELSTANGKVYINDTAIDAFTRIVVRDGLSDRVDRELTASTPRSIIHKLMQDTGDVLCGLDLRPLCIKVPTRYVIFPPPGDEILVFVGAAYMKVQGTLPCINLALKNLRYMGMEDYNNNVPPEAPADKAGCILPNQMPPAAEYINLTVTDGKYSGCVENIEKSDFVRIEMKVASVEQPLIISAPESAEAVEGFRFSFSSYRCEQVAVNPGAICGAIQVLSRDNGDVTLLDRFFRVTLKTSFGTLSIKDAPSGLEYRKGDGTDDPELVIFGKLCDVNAALRTMSYMPNPDFNTAYDKVNKSWVPATSREFIDVVVEQPSADETRLVGPSALLTCPCEQCVHGTTTWRSSCGCAVADKGKCTCSSCFPISVKYVDKVATMGILMPGTAADAAGRGASDGASRSATAGRRQDTRNLSFPLSTAMSDIFFCGGDVPCDCPASALACVRVEDGDSCDAKERAGVSCDSRQFPTTNPRLLIRSTFSSVWFFDGEAVAAWEAGASCSAGARAISTRHIKEMGNYRPGAKLHAIDVMLPLPLLQAGVLRVWASREHYGTDVLTLSLQGVALPGASSIIQQNSPLLITLENTWCAAQTPPICLGGGASSAGDDRLKGSAISGMVIVILGLVGAAVLGLLFVGLGPGAGITRIMGYGQAQRLARSEAEKLAQLSLSIAEYKETDPGGQWIMARDNRRRPFWYHTYTRETTWVDPSLASERSVGRVFDSIVERQDVDELQSPNSLMRSRFGAAHKGDARSRYLDSDSVDDEHGGVMGGGGVGVVVASNSERRRHEETGIAYSVKDIAHDAVTADFPGAWNAQADLGDDVDNSYITAMLLTKSEWVRDNDKAGDITGPLRRLADERQAAAAQRASFADMLGPRAEALKQYLDHRPPSTRAFSPPFTAK